MRNIKQPSLLGSAAKSAIGRLRAGALLSDVTTRPRISAPVLLCGDESFYGFPHFRDAALKSENTEIRPRVRNIDAPHHTCRVADPSTSPIIQPNRTTNIFPNCGHGIKKSKLSKPTSTRGRGRRGRRRSPPRPVRAASSETSSASKVVGRWCVVGARRTTAGFDLGVGRKGQAIR